MYDSTVKTCLKISRFKLLYTFRINCDATLYIESDPLKILVNIPC